MKPATKWQLYSAQGIALENSNNKNNALKGQFKYHAKRKRFNC
jgi:hypothetical protein